MPPPLYSSKPTVDWCEVEIQKCCKTIITCIILFLELHTAIENSQHQCHIFRGTQVKHLYIIFKSSWHLQISLQFYILTPCPSVWSFQVFFHCWWCFCFNLCYFVPVAKISLHMIHCSRFAPVRWVKVDGIHCHSVLIVKHTFETIDICHISVLNMITITQKKEDWL